MLKLSKSPENRARIERLGTLMDDLNKGREQIAAQRLQIIDAREKGVDGADITIFNIEIARIRKEVTSPAAVELEFGAWRFSVKPAAIGVKAAYPDSSRPRWQRRLTGYRPAGAGFMRSSSTATASRFTW
jgi:hypothetical protein